MEPSANPATADSQNQSRRQWLLKLYAAGIFLALVGFALAQPGGTSLKNANATYATSTGYAIYDEVLSEVLPDGGFQSKIALGESVTKLVAEGVIDRDKFESLYKDQGGLPKELEDVLDNPMNEPIILTKDNANVYVNLLWPLGLSNYMAENPRSPINGDDLSGFASTGGWNIGKEENGGAYFNKFKIVPLTPEQEKLVMTVAENSYRPCCDNSTFFQDCNHGSALLGLLELGASQGLDADELYREALAFNSFWFPQNYVSLGLYFKAVKNTDWKDVDPQMALGKDYSSATGNYAIQAEVAKIPNLIPMQSEYGGANCGT